jgi:hypothetical protein
MKIEINVSAKELADFVNELQKPTKFVPCDSNGYCDNQGKKIMNPLSKD